MVSAAAPAHDLPSSQGLLGMVRANTAKFVEMNASLGGLFTRAQAALLLGVAKQRVAQLVQEGRLREHAFTIEHADGTSEVVGLFISGAQIERHLVEGKKPMGRPSKLRLALAAAEVK